MILKFKFDLDSIKVKQLENI